jgi:chromosome segregation ATPase
MARAPREIADNRPMTIDERLEFLIQSAESHDRQIGELTDKVNSLTAKMDRLTESVDRMATTVTNLALIVESHERRISNLEDGK